MNNVTVSHHDGRVVAVKTGDDEELTNRLLAEADLLARLDHPGLVQLIDVDPGPPGRLVTAFVGPDSWDRFPPTEPRDMVTGLARVAAIVADLHDAGVTHGGLALDHVLVGADGAPILCGLADWTVADDDGRLADAVALAGMVRQLAADLSPPDRSDLLGLAEQLDTGESLRTITHQLDRLDRTSDGIGMAAAEPRRILPVAVGVGLLIMILTVVFVRGDGPDPVPTPPAAPRVSVAPAPVSDSPDHQVGPDPASVSLTVPATSTTTTATGAGPSLPTGPHLDHDGRRYALGEAGDIAVVGDWDCDGVPTPAVLRPGTGEIAVFRAWPEPDAPLEARAFAVVEGAHTLDVEAGPDCDQLRARTDSGSRLIEMET